MMYRRHLPAEIDGVLDAGIHAESAGRREQVHGISGKVNPAIAVPVRHQRIARRPFADRNYIDIDIRTDGIQDIPGDVRFIRLAGLRVLRQDDKLAFGIQGDDTGPGIAVDGPVLPRAVRLHHVVNTGRVDIDRQHATDEERNLVAAFAAVGNFQRAAGIAVGAVAPGKPPADDRLGVAGFGMPDRRFDTVGVLREIDQFPAEP